ncbi:hypothetical protein [Litorimonas sp. WD9-15]|uniref:hypothetical protein n=1 Tax=Litorimonas sp. WD9-15 TaxID=3418716 RepID=UPI003D04DB6A
MMHLLADQLRPVFGTLSFVILTTLISTQSFAQDNPGCAETPRDHQSDWTVLPEHVQMQSRFCHSQLSDALKAGAETNERLSHAVYHQILAGESFRDIPLWPDKHEGWVKSYEGYDYTNVFSSALEAADDSWDQGFEDGGKHDFAVGWTQTVTEDDFRINDYRNRTGNITGVKSYLVIPGLILIFLVLTEAIIDRLGLFPGMRFFYRYKYR